MKAYFILYNQINKNYFTKDIDNFLYVHHNWTIKFNWEKIDFNLRSKILDYALGYNFVQELKSIGKNAFFEVSKDYFSAILDFCLKTKTTQIYITKPCENYVYKNFLKIKEKLKNHNIELIFLQDENSFLLSHNEFLQNFKKPPVMETFYRFMRKKFDILMEWDKPVWWAWNFDKENRWFKKDHKKTWNFNLLENIWVKEAKKFYKTDISINYPTNRQEAILLLNYFIKNHLDNFWFLEDAMYDFDNMVHHSNISTCINFGLLSPLEVIKVVEKTTTSINNKEWFIRQILWWREFMYHFFEFYKDDIYKNNYFNHKKPLPEFFWNKDLRSNLNCLDNVINNVLDNNYSHHITRLMIIWNYALLKNYNPFELNTWFLVNYTDAFEWVVTPNVLAMSQFADWWKLATKPYISWWNYINKMSNYCKNCNFDIKTKYEKNSCPYNYLYWNFIYDNKGVFEKVRQSFVLKNLEKIDIEKIKNIYLK